MNTANEHHFSFEHIRALTIAATILLFPFIIFPFTLDIFLLPKQILLLISSAVLLILFVLETIQTKKLVLRLAPVSIVLLVFFVLHGVALFFKNVNSVASITNSMGVGTLLALLILHFSILRIATFQYRQLLERSLTLSGILLAVVSVVWATGISSRLTLPLFRDKFFTPTGALLITSMVLVISFAITVGHLLRLYKGKNKTALPIWIASSLLLWAGIIVVGFHLFSDARPLLMPPQVGWSVALKALEGRPLLGVGVANYEHAYVAGKPASINSDPTWNFRFGLGPNIVFHYLTTLGIAGGIIVLLIGYLLLREVLTTPTPATFGIGIILLFSLVTPPNLITLFFLFLLSAMGTGTIIEKIISLPKKQELLLFLFLLPLGFILLLGSLFSPVLLSEIQARESVTALSQNNANTAYTSIHAAVTTTPYRDDLWALSSRITLAIATAIINQPNVSDAQKQRAIDLIDQSLKEAKKAIEVAPYNSTNWENLADIYKSLVPTFQQADAWAVASYEQAIARDPANPVLRANVAALLDFQGNTAQAVQVLETAVTLKPDYTPARYSLALGYIKQQKYQQALDQLKATLQLLPGNSDDAKKVNEDIQAVQKLADQANKAVKEPIPTPTPTKGPKKLPLTENQAPPQAFVTPSPTPTPTSVPQPKPNL